MEEVGNTDGRCFSRLEELPDVLLQQRVLPLLNATDLGRLACCNTRLHTAALADHLWYPLFILHNSSLINRPYRNKKRLSDPPPYPWQSWHQAFCSKQNIRCVECKEHTPYVFTLLPSNVRLCERCEYTCPKYALVTEREARGRYLLDDEDLHNLQYKKVRIRKFYVYLFLRSAVEAISHGKGADFEGRNQFRDKHEEETNECSIEANCSKPRIEAWTEGDGSSSESNKTQDDDDTLAEDVSNTMVSSVMNKNEKPLNGSVELKQDMAVQGLENAKHASDREERKALRKEHKRQVKAENREKRLGKKLGKSPNGEHSCAENSGKNSFHLKEIENADENLSIGDSGKFKKKHRTKRDHERDWLESELGRNGISALELAQF
ncbi:hypothetical protein SUGI_0809350 [Cryptomeria japonica]|nr:hypothetical protein SUGI_0809350 [Cryptomeria japonica]